MERNEEKEINPQKGKSLPFLVGDTVPVTTDNREHSKNHRELLTVKERSRKEVGLKLGLRSLRESMQARMTQ